MQRYGKYTWTNSRTRVCVYVFILVLQEIARARIYNGFPFFSFFFLFPVCRRSERRERKLEEKNYNGRLFCTATIIRTKYAWLPTCRRHLPRRSRLHFLASGVTFTTIPFFPHPCILPISWIYAYFPFHVHRWPPRRHWNDTLFCFVFRHFDSLLS